MKSIEVANLVKKYGKLALGPYNFSVENHDVIAIIGPNGAGKTTLITMIAGIRRPNGGSIKVNEKENYTVAYLPEVEGAPDTMTISDYAEILASIYNVTKSRIEKSMVDEVGLSPKKKFGEMSKGQKRKCLIAAITSLPADAILLDEPFSGLDVVSRYNWKQRLKSIAKKQGLVIMTSHEMYDVEEVADWIVFINKGKVLFTGTVSEVKEKTGCSTLECAFMHLKDNP